MKLLLYCTKRKPYLIGGYHDYYLNNGGKYSVMDARDLILNGKIVAECDFEVEKIKGQSWQSDANRWYSSELLEKSCLHVFEIDNYLKGKEGYAIHIKNLKIFDVPKKLSDYYKAQSTGGYSPCWNCKIFGSGCYTCNIKPPQNMMYVYDRQGNKYALISIRPEWLCKILNGEKTIEVRRKVLKEMIK